MDKIIIKITPHQIKTRFKEIAAQVESVLPKQQWIVQPLEVAIRSDMEELGRVDGNQIIINSYFINTTAVRELDIVIKINFLLSVLGEENKFKKVFYEFAAMLGVYVPFPKMPNKAMLEKLKKARFQLYAILETGERHDMGKVVRKTKRYEKYGEDDFVKKFYLNGKMIVRFEYCQIC